MYSFPPKSKLVQRWSRQRDELDKLIIDIQLGLYNSQKPTQPDVKVYKHLEPSTVPFENAHYNGR